jgi:glycosyltransferase involved in cell wall biosynthesis
LPADIVCFSPIAWTFPCRQRIHHVMAGLGRSRRILFVNPETLFFTRGATISDVWNAGRLEREVEPGVGVLVPLALRPDQSWGEVRPETRALRISAVKRAMSDIGMDRPILWLYHPREHYVVGLVDERGVVYDCIDAHAEFDAIADKGKARRDEAALAASADLLLASSPTLVHGREDALLVPNAADVARFALPTAAQAPADIASLPRPVIGYTGTIAEWFDFDLVGELAARMPNASFVLIGPSHTEAPDAVRAAHNVHLLGAKPYDELPAYLAAFDVAMIPFVENELTFAVDPVKVYEYLAAGRPVVSSRLPELARFADVVRIASGADEFAAQIDAALADGPDEAAKRQAAVRGHDWSDRIRVIEQALERLEAR